MTTKSDSEEKTIFHKDTLKIGWVIHSYSDAQICISPHEACVTKNGIETFNYTIDFSEKFEKNQSFYKKLLTPQDYKALSRYIQYSYDANILWVLAGHPFVYFGYNELIKIEQGEPYFFVNEKNGLFTIGSSIHRSGYKKSGIFHTNQQDLCGKIVISGRDEYKICVSLLTNNLREIIRISDKTHLNGGVSFETLNNLLNTIYSLSENIKIHFNLESPMNGEQLVPDETIHIYVSSHGVGLKLEMMMKPIPDIGYYHTIGSGSSYTGTLISGNFYQVTRNLTREIELEEQLIKYCPALKKTTKKSKSLSLVETELDSRDTEKYWILEEPALCLEFLSQVRENKNLSNKIKLYWLGVEKFKISRVINKKMINLSIRCKQNWFEVSGEIKIDNEEVYSLCQLLRLIKQSNTRFIEIDDHFFIVLTEKFYEQLKKLSTFSEITDNDKAIRVHSIMTSNLKEFTKDVEKIKTDNLWKENLNRLAKLESTNMKTEVPATFKGILRDYQLEGFRWLVRLSQLKFGACLADDMGLGKTIQALALLLHRASEGTALIVCPTSVCTNWLNEASHFTPDLKLNLFNTTKNREKLLSTLSLFDVVIVSYNVLQQNIETFQQIHWHTQIEVSVTSLPLF